ncbi:MAG: tetratricopeptide repeat protein [Phycisphaerales bacterium]|nr:MAG: tetratricopeptide repeat protein [Phycisphaerales bacterium]
MHKSVTYVLIGVAGVAVAVALVWTATSRTRTPQIEDILAAYHDELEYGGLTISYPLDETVFPPEIVAPTFRWQDESAESETWLVTIRFENGEEPLSFLAHDRQWTASPEDWEIVKHRSLENWARVTILGVGPSVPAKIFSGSHISIMTSADEVGAPLFYREVNLPFLDAVKDPSHIRWRFGTISSPKGPPVVLQSLPVCGNCHSFNKTGQALAMDVDYANSKGSYVITRVAQEMVLATSDIITWNDYKKEDGEQTFGLLSQISPDGRFVVSTVKDKSVFVPRPDLAFSQLFFPLKGILCVYDRQSRTFQALPGADDPQHVQSNPTWSPDGKHIVFARAKAYDLKNTRGKGKLLLTREECKEFVEDGKPFLFDLYRIPFNEGGGGKPVPLEGASNNGMSNFFAKYSPDGRWIVFCRAKSYMLLQPDSELYIIPADGGEARRLRGNTNRMNSWHSWSPNGKWLVFSSKAYSDYTQLFLTHIDDQGRSTPPVTLSHLTAPDRAANIPEFVNVAPSAIKRIREDFLNDYSFVRAGNEFYRRGDMDNAIEEYQNALELNPDNVDAHQKLGFLLFNVKGMQKDGYAHLTKALRLDPRNGFAHHDLGMALLHRSEFDPAIKHLAEALRLMPNGFDKQYDAANMHRHLGQALHQKGKLDQARTHLAKAIALDPNDATAHYILAIAVAEQGDLNESLGHYHRAIRLEPKVDTSPSLHYLFSVRYAEARRFQEAIQSAEKALRLSRAAGEDKLAAHIEQQLVLYGRANKSLKSR